MNIFNGMHQRVFFNDVPLATEGKTMGVTRDVVSFAFLSYELPLLHVGRL